MQYEEHRAHSEASSTLRYTKGQALRVTPVARYTKGQALRVTPVGRGPVRDGGFTLVEVLIVIVILGILSTVVLFALRSTTSQASANACASEHRSMNTAFEAYLAQEDALSVPATGTGADRHERSLVDVGILRAVSPNWELAADGTMTAQAGGICG